MTSYFIIEDHYQSLFLYTVITIASIIIAYQFVFFLALFGETSQDAPGLTRPKENTKASQNVDVCMKVSAFGCFQK